VFVAPGNLLNLLWPILYVLLILHANYPVSISLAIAAKKNQNQQQKKMKKQKNRDIQMGL
jgi:hypothetical protein